MPANLSLDVSTFAKRYIENLTQLLHSLDLEKLSEIITVLQETREEGGTVYLIGNGGSAATASHMALDLAFCTRMCSGPRLRAVSLSENAPYITAAANDLEYASVFVEQLRNFLRTGDVVIAISASGNSENLVRAIEYANAEHAKTIGLLGFDGGRLKELCGIALHVESPKGQYGPIEDVHMILDHLITAYFIEHG